MIKQTIQVSGLEKKPYAKPQMKAYQVMPTAIICTSPKTTNTNEEYETVETSSWF